MQSLSRIASRLFDISDYEVIKPINSGGFASVYLVKNIKTKQLFAAKIAHQDDSGGSKQEKFVSREIGILIRVQAPTIIRFYGFSLQDFHGDPNVTILMDFKENGSLEQMIYKEEGSQVPHDYDNTAKQKILCGVAHGMMTLHAKRVIHRDLKPANVLLDSNYKPCITDFGLSKFLDPMNSKLQSMAGCGTAPYMAPEVFDGNHYGPKADVYSFGILMYEVILGERAYSTYLKQRSFNSFKIAAKVLAGERPAFTRDIKTSLKQLIEQCWAQDPHERPSFRELYYKLSLSLESDDTAFTSKFDSVISPQKVDETSTAEEEDFDYYQYCLDNVDTDQLFDYIEEITAPEKLSSAINETPLLAKIEEQSKLIAQLQDQIVKIDKENKEQIESLQQSHQKKIETLKSQNEQNQKEIEALKIEVEALKNTKESKPKPKPKRSSKDHKVSTVKSISVPSMYSISCRMNGSLFDGIFEALRKLNNGDNPCTSEIISIMPSTHATGDVSTLLDHDTKWFGTKDQKNSYIVFDFKSMQVMLNGYSIKTHSTSSNGHITGWVLEGSNDNSDYTMIDNVPNCDAFHDPSVARYFPINRSTGYYRFIRIFQTRQNTMGYYNLRLGEVEFFGQTRENTMGYDNLRLGEVEFVVQKRENHPTVFRMKNNRLFDGIFQHLRDINHGNNPCIDGIIQITSSGDLNATTDVLLDHDKEKWFGTRDQKNSYLIFDFMSIKVSLEGYSIQTHSSTGNGHITGWILEGSNDGSKYTQVDSVETQIFNEAGVAHYFSLKSDSAFYRYFKLTQNRPNTKGYHNLRLSQVEFFGTIKK